MKNLLILFLVFQLSVIGFSQNLVPNPSFEEYYTCPTDLGQTYRAKYWTIRVNTADYFNRCDPTEYHYIDIPNNSFGNQEPPDINCSAYIGLYSYSWLNIFWREFVGAKLINSLIIGSKYYISFKVNLAIHSNLNTICATNKLGLLFTNVNYGVIEQSPMQSPFNSNFAHIYSDEIINDTTNWVAISGSFIADSAYKYFMIGKFFDILHTNFQCDTNNESSYYFVDDVCISTDSITCNPFIYYCTTDVSNNSYCKDVIFSQISFSEFTVEICENISSSKEIELFNIVGIKQPIEVSVIDYNKIKINTLLLKNGIYILKINFINKIITKKISINN